MSAYARQRSDQIVKIRAFTDANPAVFSAGIGATQMPRLLQMGTDLLAALAAQAGDKSGATGATSAKDEEFDDLVTTVDAMAASAAHFADKGVGSLFSRPVNEAQGTYRASAQSFKDAATPPAVQAMFVDMGMDAGFLTALGAVIAAYDATHLNQAASGQTRSLTTAEVKTLVRESGELVAMLDQFAFNRIGRDQALWPSWVEASKLGTIPRAHKAAASAAKIAAFEATPTQN